MKIYRDLNADAIISDAFYTDIANADPSSNVLESVNTNTSNIDILDNDILELQAIVDSLETGATSQVVGPVSSVDNALARYDSTTGKIIQDSIAILDDVGKLTAPSLATSNFTLPTSDGTVGQQIGTDGLGNLFFSDAGTGDVSGPASSTDNKVTRFDGTTGKTIQDSLVTIDDVGKLTAPSLATSNFTLPTSDGTVGQQIGTDGLGTLFFSDAGTGDVSGPASSTDNKVTRFDGTTGKTIQDSLVTVDDAGKLTAPSLATSNFTLPTSDGTVGQTIATDGAGTLSFADSSGGDVSGPASSTDNAVARYDSTTGKIIQNSTATLDDVGKLTAPSLATSNYTLPISDGMLNQVITSDGAGTLSFASIESSTDHFSSTIYEDISFVVGGTPLDVQSDLQVTVPTGKWLFFYDHSGENNDSGSFKFTQGTLTNVNTGLPLFVSKKTLTHSGVPIGEENKMSSSFTAIGDFSETTTIRVDWSFAPNETFHVFAGTILRAWKILNGAEVPQLVSDYTLQASYANVGYSVFLPLAGTYLVIYDARHVIDSSSTTVSHTRLFNTTLASVVVDSEVLLNSACCSPASSSQKTVSAKQIITVLGPTTLNLQAKYTGSFAPTKHIGATTQFFYQLIADPLDAIYSVFPTGPSISAPVFFNTQMNIELTRGEWLVCFNPLLNINGQDVSVTEGRLYGSVSGVIPETTRLLVSGSTQVTQFATTCSIVSFIAVNTKETITLQLCYIGSGVGVLVENKSDDGKPSVTAVRLHKELTDIESLESRLLNNFKM